MSPFRATALVLATLAALAMPHPARGELTAAQRTKADTLIRLFERSNAVSDFDLPTDLGDDRWKELLEGGVARIMEKVDMPDANGEPRQRRRAWAFRLAPTPRTWTWVAATHPDFLPSDRVSEARVSADSSGAEIWYQYIRLPWPVRDRHWVIRIRCDPAVSAATDGVAWEQSWDLVPDGLARARELVARGDVPGVTADNAKGAVALEANTGAWTLFDLGGEGTLIVYQATVVLGGWIPDALAARFAMGELESLLNKVSRNALRVPEAYDPDVFPIEDGDGHVIPRLATPGGGGIGLGGPAGALRYDEFDPDLFTLGRPPERR